MSKQIFAVGATRNSLNNEICEVTTATIERINTPGFNGIEIVNRAGVKMCLDFEAAEFLAHVLPKFLKENA